MREPTRSFSSIATARFAAMPEPELRADLALDARALPSETAEALSGILREALRNIELHACARRVEIELREQDGVVHLDIRDDGVGFDLARPAAGHFGLLGMRERAAAIDATLDIVSAPGQGARLSLRAPLGGRESQSNSFGS